MIHRSEQTDRATGTVTVVEVDTTTKVVAGTVDGVTSTRPMTPEEVQHFAAVEQAELERSNEAELIDQSADTVDKLVAVVEALNAITALTNATINANPAAVLKDLARQCKTIARQVNREARLTSGRTEDTDTGPVTDV